MTALAVAGVLAEFGYQSATGHGRPRPPTTPSAPAAIFPTTGADQPVAMDCLSVHGGAARLAVSVGLVSAHGAVRLAGMSARGVGLRLIGATVVPDCSGEHPGAPVSGAELRPGRPRALYLRFAVVDCGILPHLPALQVSVRSRTMSGRSRSTTFLAELGSSPPVVVIACELAHRSRSQGRTGTARAAPGVRQVRGSLPGGPHTGPATP